MIRFRVIKASHLLLVVSLLVLAAVIALVLLMPPPGRSADGIAAGTSEEAKAVSVFASKPYDDAPFQIEIVRKPKADVKQSDAKRILIYHTHTHEAYQQEDDDPYEAVETWRTTDSAHSVVRVGEALADALRKLGYDVTHDLTDHEQNELSTAYARSLATLQGYAEEFDLIIDLHRDAYSEGLTPCIHDSNGTEYAQFMLLVGRGDNYLPENKPDYEENLQFAQKITHEANRILPGICRNVTVKSGRYNQHMGARAILLEVGHNQNTLTQALASVSCIADSISAALLI